MHFRAVHSAKFACKLCPRRRMKRSAADGAGSLTAGPLRRLLSDLATPEAVPSVIGYGLLPTGSFFPLQHISMRYTNASVQIIRNYSHPTIKSLSFSREIVKLRVKLRKKGKKFPTKSEGLFSVASNGCVSQAVVSWRVCPGALPGPPSGEPRR